MKYFCDLETDSYISLIKVKTNSRTFLATFEGRNSQCLENANKSFYIKFYRENGLNFYCDNTFKILHTKMHSVIYLVRKA